MKKVTAFLFSCPEDRHLAESAREGIRANGLEPVDVFDKNHEGIVAMEAEALRGCKTEWAWFVHADSIPKPGCLKELLKMANRGVGAVEAELIHPDGSRAHFKFNKDLSESPAKCGPNPNSIHTVCTLFRTGLKLKHGYFPPKDFSQYYDDTWVSLSLAHDGWKLKHAAKAVASHVGSASDRLANPILRLKRRIQKRIAQKKFHAYWKGKVDFLGQ
jgi:GT2 family glycosyltransferase